MKWKKYTAEKMKDPFIILLQAEIYTGEVFLLPFPGYSEKKYCNPLGTHDFSNTINLFFIKVNCVRYVKSSS